MKHRLENPPPPIEQNPENSSAVLTTIPTNCDAPLFEAPLKSRYKEIMTKHQHEITFSQRFPYNIISYIIAFFYCGTLSVIALCIQLFKQPQTGYIEQRLSEMYVYVPEMALHKSIELNAFSQKHVSGRGIDLGCGGGQVGGILAQVCQLDQLYGIDFLDHFREMVIQNGYAGFISGDLQKLPIEDAHFDYAVSICVIEHIPELGKALSETARILKPGGHFVFSTVSPQFRTSTAGYCILSFLGLRQKAKAFQEMKDIHAQHYNYLSAEEWQNILLHYGFENVEIMPIFSQFQLFVYDLMNFQAYFLKFYFADKLQKAMIKYPALQQWLQWVTAIICTESASIQVTDKNETHYLISCVKA